MQLAEKIEQMFALELSLGGRAAKQYALLDSVKRKELPIDGLDSYLLFNPGRVRSVMADVSPETLAHRKCFLCPDGVEDKQQSLPWGDYVIRINPFPIFRRHLTISSAKHEPQLIGGHYENMLRLAAELPEYAIFYNGPRCGASAPDHMHFQAVPINALPLQRWSDLHATSMRLLVDVEWTSSGLSHNAENTATLPQNDNCQPQNPTKNCAILQFCNTEIRKIDVFCPSAYLITGKNIDEMEAIRKRLINAIGHDINVISWVKDGFYKSIIIFRSKSRPDCFFAESDEERILISPATVEMAGVAIVASEDSFNKLDARKLRNIIREVSLPGGNI